MRRIRTLLAVPAIVATVAVSTAWTSDVAEHETPVFLYRLWSAFAGGPDRVSVARPGNTGPLSITTPRWIKNGDELASFEFYGQAGVVTTPELVIAVGFQVSGDRPTSSMGQDAIVAFRRVDGSVSWTAPAPIALLDSWATPSVDVMNNTLVLAAGARVIAFSLADGSVSWSTNLDRIVVNVSPVVTYDLHMRNRAFITDHSFASGGTGRLYCINVSPRHPIFNPFDLGEIVWTVDLGGQTSGNTPAYRDGVVFVSTATGGAQWDQGTVKAYPAGATSAPQPLWVYEHTDPSGFFSGVAVRAGGVYGSTYSFHGGQFSASTVRIDRWTGAQRWRVPTNRTDTVPVPMSNGYVLVSGGVPYTAMFPVFGSLPSLQLIRETPGGGNAVLLWDSATATHQDFNQNGAWDPGEPYLSLGGWTNQPIAVDRIDGTPAVFVGNTPDTASDGFFGHSRAMQMVDLTKAPTEAGFLIESTPDCGGSPAVVGSELYAVGAEGVYAFGAPAWPRGQVIARWLNQTLPDFNGDGKLDWADFGLALQYAED